MEFRYVLAVLILDICHVVKVSGDSTLIDVEFCKYSQTTRKAVETCPSDERSWKEAASKMNCSDHAENCAGKMAYHCLINPWQNLTVEVCAPETRIRAGFCAEYNRRGGKIQEFYSKTCKGCTQNYQSTEAYKYQECYEKVYQFTQQQKQPQTKQSNQSKITSLNEDRNVPVYEDRNMFEYRNMLEDRYLYDRNASNRNKCNLRYISIVVVLLVILSL